MGAGIKAEFRKLFTVRSTYVICAIALLLVLFIAGYAQGYKANPKSLLMNRGLYSDAVIGALNIAGVFIGLIAILLFSHEYRYNTIMYSLTSTNSRSKFLLSKITVMTVFAVVFTTVMCVLSPLVLAGGLGLGNHVAPSQTMDIASLVWRCLFYGWGFAMIGLLLVALARNQVFAIVLLFLTPSTIEPIATLFLKNNAQYLPFTALGHVVQQAPEMSYTKAAATVVVYIVIGWLVAWLLFLRRDAT